MNKEMVVLQGKTFTIELQSMLGSTPYGWCLSELPQGIILIGEDRVPTAPGIAPVMQKFYFGASSVEEENVEIVFSLVNCFDPTDKKSECKASIRIISSDSEEFVAYSDNANALYGFCDTANAAIPYGYASNQGVDNAQLPYGMVYTQDASMKYGYPCGMRDAAMKYGYPCGVQDASMKYGYIPQLMYGITPTLMYGVPCSMSNVVHKYGYPGCC